MKKRTYKQMQNRLYREIHQRMLAEEQIAPEKESAEYYKKRFMAFGSNVETVEGKGYIDMLKWEVQPEPWGHYARVDESFFQMGMEEAFRGLKGDLVRHLVDQLLENNLVQFYTRGYDVKDIMYPMGTIGAKLYVIPWEQMPHRRTLELKQYVEATIEEGR